MTPEVTVWPRVRRLGLLVSFLALLLVPASVAAPVVVALLGASLVRAGVGGRSSLRARAATLRGAEETIGLGVDPQGRQVTAGAHELTAHGLILGASGAGKSTTLLRILTEQIRRGGPVVALDLKGSPRFEHELRVAAAASGRELVVWSPDGPGHWNPLRYGNATELKDKLIATERFSEPHYQRAAERYVQMVLGLLLEAHPARAPSLDEVVALMEPQRLSPLLREVSDERADRVRDYIASLSHDQLSAIRGLGTRLAIISESHVGRYLTDASHDAVDLRKALAGGAVVLFSLNSSRYGKLSAQIGTLAVQDLVAAVGHRLTAGERRPALVGIDEFSALGADNVISLLARGREAGVGVVLATQELADLDRAARGLRDQVLGNTALKIVHRQDVPRSAQTIAEIAGTRMVWQPTFQIGGGLLGAYDRSRGTQRQVERFVIDPNEIKSLPTGNAVVIANGSGLRPRRVQVASPEREGRAGVRSPRAAHHREARDAER